MGKLICFRESRQYEKKNGGTGGTVMTKGFIPACWGSGKKKLNGVAKIHAGSRGN